MSTSHRSATGANHRATASGWWIRRTRSRPGRARARPTTTSGASKPTRPACPARNTVAHLPIGTTYRCGRRGGEHDARRAKAPARTPLRRRNAVVRRGTRARVPVSTVRDAPEAPRLPGGRPTGARRPNRVRARVRAPRGIPNTMRRKAVRAVIGSPASVAREVRAGAVTMRRGPHPAAVSLRCGGPSRSPAAVVRRAETGTDRSGATRTVAGRAAPAAVRAGTRSSPSGTGAAGRRRNRHASGPTAGGTSNGRVRTRAAMPNRTVVRRRERRAGPRARRTAQIARASVPTAVRCRHRHRTALDSRGPIRPTGRPRPERLSRRPVGRTRRQCRARRRAVTTRRTGVRISWTATAPLGPSRLSGTARPETCPNPHAPAVRRLPRRTSPTTMRRTVIRPGHVPGAGWAGRRTGPTIERCPMRMAPRNRPNCRPDSTRYRPRRAEGAT